MAALSAPALAALVRAHFPAGAQVTAYAIARAESGGRPEAVGDGGQSFGLWQVYRPAHPQYPASWLLNPDNNAIAALEISRTGTNWNPWCTWEPSACGGRGSGAYRAYLAEATAALATPAPSPAWIPVAAVVPLPSSASGWWWVGLLGVGLWLARPGR